MTRRRLLHTGLALTAGSLAAPVQAGQFTGKIRKSLKWTMVKNAKDMPLADAFKKLRECGYDGVEPIALRPSGALGRDNQEVYGDWLGLSDDELRSLQAEEVI